MPTFPTRPPLPALALLLCGLTALGGCTEKLTLDQRIQAAEQSMEKSRYRDAIIDMRSLLRQRPDYAPARIALGKALMAVGDMQAAEKELDRAKQMGASPNDYMEPLARALQSRDAHALVLADLDPDILNDAAARNVMRALHGRSMLAMGSRNQAAAVFDAQIEQTLSIEATRIALLGKATMAADDQRLDDAETHLQKALKLAPGSAESILALGRAYITQAKFSDAKTLLLTARDTNMQARRQDWFFIEGQLTEALLGLGELDAARESAATMLSLGKTHPMAAYLQGRVELDSGNTNEAIQNFQTVLADYPSYSPALTLMGVAMLERDDFDQAEMHLSEAVASDPDNVQTRRLLAETRMRMGRSRAAVATLEAGLRNNSADSAMMTLLGQESMRMGERKDGMRYLAQALQASPENLQANLALAQAYVTDGEIAKAVSVLESLPPSALSDARRDILIRIAQLDRSNETVAQQQIEALLGDNPDDLSVKGLAGSFYAAIGQLDIARRFFDDILARSPDNRSAMLSLLNLDERSGNFARSTALFEAEYAKQPGDLLPALVLARIFSAQGQDERALQMVRDAHQKHPTALLPNLILGAQALRDNNFVQAVRFSDVAANNYPKSPEAQALGGLIKMRQSRIDEAVANFRRAVVQDPGDAQYRYYLGQADLANERLRQARTSFNDALARDAQHLGALRALALMDAEAGKTPQANQRVREITNKFGADWSATIAIADVRAVQGQANEAIELYERAQIERPSWAVALELYRVRVANDITNPTQSIDAWLAQRPDDINAHLKLAQAFQQGAETNKAIASYERVLELDPTQALANNNVAWLYLERDAGGDGARALTAAQRAYDQSTENSDVADTLGWVLYRSDQLEEALDVLRRAMQWTTADKSPDIAYHFATALNARGNARKAREILDQALRSSAPFASREDAQLLRAQL
ncbi:MAG: XrtA/PEP-CTERM system TPR-repeat protein PrsT [Gammaproteobacteria bacterium]